MAQADTGDSSMTLSHSQTISITQWDDDASEEFVVGQMAMTAHFDSIDDNDGYMPTPSLVEVRNESGNLLFAGRWSDEGCDIALDEWVRVSGEDKEAAIADGVFTNLFQAPEQIVRSYYQKKWGVDNG